MRFRMKTSNIAILSGIFTLSTAVAQIVVPASPKKFVTRPIGGGTSGGAIITPGENKPQKVRYTTHLVLTEYRIWTSTDGKTITAKLIAFEDMVAELPKGSAEPTPPTPPAHPTVVQDGKVRLAFADPKKKPFFLPLERLSQPDRDFIETIRLAHAKKSAEPAP